MDRPRTEIRLETAALALSLSGRLEQLAGTGERSISSHEDGSCAVRLYEFPRQPEQVQDILDAVAAWLDEVGHPEVFVEFRWHLQQSQGGATRATQPVLYWKCEDGPAEAGPRGSPEDVGPAWLQTHGARGSVTQEPVNGGEWIRRIDALSLAHAKGYTVSIDG